MWQWPLVKHFQLDIIQCLWRSWVLLACLFVFKHRTYKILKALSLVMALPKSMAKRLSYSLQYMLFLFLYDSLDIKVLLTQNYKKALYSILQLVLPSGQISFGYWFYGLVFSFDAYLWWSEGNSFRIWCWTTELRQPLKGLMVLHFSG